jgi:hypothetical protein
MTGKPDYIPIDNCSINWFLNRFQDLGLFQLENEFGEFIQDMRNLRLAYPSVI